MVQKVLGIDDVVHGDELVVLVRDSGPVSSQLLHLAAHSEQQTEMDADGTHVRARLALDPEDALLLLLIVLDQLVLVDGTDTQLTLHGGNERRALEEGTGQLQKCILRIAVFETL